MLRIRRYLIILILTLMLIVTVTPVPAKYPISSNPSLLEQGNMLYNQGNLAEAAQIWEQATKSFKKTGEKRALALSYNYLAIVYQDLGNWSAATTNINQALKLGKTIDDPLLYAQILNTQGSLQLNITNPETALETWQLTEKTYRSVNDTRGIVLSQINQAQALQTLGFYRRAQKKLEQINQDLQPLPDSLLKARGLRSLGITLQVVGDLEQSQQVLSQSLDIAKKLKSDAEIAQTFLILANTAREYDNFDTALNYYQQAATIANNSRTKVKAQINQLSLLVKLKRQTPALQLLPVIKQNLGNLPPSRGSIYSRVNLAATMMKMRQWGIKNREIADILATSIQQAQKLKDTRAESYAVGQLGYVYEQNGQLAEALNLTKQALSLAQKIRGDDIAVNWLWQEGRILKILGDQKGAITVYSQAVNNLESLRQDLVQMSPDVQFSFRDEVEPIYRQLVQLLLQNIDNLPKKIQQQRLQQSRTVIESLQVAELENFLRASCLTFKPEPIEKIDKSAGIIYPIILDNRIEIIASLPEKPLQHYGQEILPAEQAKVFKELRSSLNSAFLANEVLPSAQKIYDWLLRPIEAEIKNQKITTLVFVLDGFLRNVPIAVLHDGKQFLVEKYNIALTPGLQLFESRNLSPPELRALTGGLVEARQGFSALPGVKAEINQVSNYLKTQVLLDGEFTRPKVQKKIEDTPFSVVHLATHGQFSSQAKDTFLLTWEDRINVKDLGQWLKSPSSNLRDEQPIELLVLSACQTAKGDERATLGLAGIAVRSGARSTLATLWSVQDKSTADLIAEFYRLMSQNRATKAEALRQAQLSLLKNPQYQHPYYWSPFVLVGNWN